jgi:arsenite methyltransferase
MLPFKNDTEKERASMNSAQSIRAEVRQAYSAIAARPQEEPLFPTGRALAEDLGYPAEWLDSLPATPVEAFCGVSNVSVFAEIPEGATVLDLGCGAGLDTLIAARRTGEKGKVIAIDFSEVMLARACRALAEARVTNVETHLADAENLPAGNESVDVAIVNGIFNLNPSRERIFSELARVVRPGGAVFAAELVLTAPLTPEERSNSTNWFS